MTLSARTRFDLPGRWRRRALRQCLCLLSRLSVGGLREVGVVTAALAGGARESGGGHPCSARV